MLGSELGGELGFEWVDAESAGWVQRWRLEPGGGGEAGQRGEEWWWGFVELCVDL